MIDLTPLESAPRLLMEVPLRPVLGARFQPTGFPDLGAATFKGPDDDELLLVESAQSMANRLESVCWDEAREQPVAALSGMPYVRVVIRSGKEQVATTSSLLEAHRLNSPYVLNAEAQGVAFEQRLLSRMSYRKGRPVDRRVFADAVFHFDPGSLLHGVFLSNVEDGRMRLARTLSAFIEAKGIQPAASGGVKNDRVNPSGDTSEGFGNVPFARTEFTAKEILAYFNLDLRQLRGFGLPDLAQRFLVILALWKIERFLADGLRLRTACDLVAGPARATTPGSFAFPDAARMEEALKESLAACASAGYFAEPATTEVVFQETEKSAKASRKAAAREQASARQDQGAKGAPQ